MDVHQVMAVPNSFGSKALVHPDVCMRACAKIDFAFSKNRTRFSAFVPWNQGKEARAERMSSYGQKAFVAEIPRHASFQCRESCLES